MRLARWTNERQDLLKVAYKLHYDTDNIDSSLGTFNRPDVLITFKLNSHNG